MSPFEYSVHTAPIPLSFHVSVVVEPDATAIVLTNWQVYWQLRLVAPQKDINIRLPVGGPCFVWGVFLALLGSSSLRSRWVGGHRVLYVVPAAAVHVAVCRVLGKL